MRLYFTDGVREIGFDTDEKVWTDEGDYSFMHDFPHRFIQVSEDDLINIEKEIDFNAWDYSRGLEPLKEAPDKWWIVTFIGADGFREEMDVAGDSEQDVRKRALDYMRTANSEPHRNQPEIINFEIVPLPEQKEGDAE